MVRLLLLCCIVLLTGCGAEAGPGPVTPVFAFTEAVVGPGRIAIGLVRQQSPLNDPAAKIHVRMFAPGNTTGTATIEADTVYYGQGLPIGFYVAYPTFTEAGEWRIEISVQLPNELPSISRQRLVVAERTDAPNVGDAAPAVQTLTAASVSDPAQLSSGGSANPALYSVSLDSALQSGKPTALLFATPAFCKTATCGPSLAVFGDLQQQYGQQVNFIHVEVYRYPFAESVQAIEQAARTAATERRALTVDERKVGYSDAMAAWGLKSEPWLYLIDGKGVVAARYEGGITSAEIGPAIQRLLAGQPVLQP